MPLSDRPNTTAPAPPIGSRAPRSLCRDGSKRSKRFIGLELTLLDLRFDEIDINTFAPRRN